MTAATIPAPRHLSSLLSPALPGLLLATLTLLFGFGLGVIFGLNEDAIKSRLSAAAAAAPAAVYPDEGAQKAVLDKAWVYMQRGHLHAGSLGAVSVALTLVLVGLGTGARITRALSIGLGAGSLGYSVFWVWAGFRAPGLGSTGAAKESLAWLAIPSSGLVVAGTFIVTGLIAAALLRSPPRES